MDLPREVVVEVFQSLELRELLDVRVVSREWSELALASALWARHLLDLFGSRPHPPLPLSSDEGRPPRASLNADSSAYEIYIYLSRIYRDLVGEWSAAQFRLGNWKSLGLLVF